MGVLCATAEKSGLLKKDSSKALGSPDYIGLPNYTFVLLDVEVVIRNFTHFDPL